MQVRAEITGQTQSSTVLRSCRTQHRQEYACTVDTCASAAQTTAPMHSNPAYPNPRPNKPCTKRQHHRPNLPANKPHASHQHQRPSQAARQQQCPALMTTARLASANHTACTWVHPACAYAPQEPHQALLLHPSTATTTDDCAAERRVKTPPCSSLEAVCCCIKCTLTHTQSFPLH